MKRILQSMGLVALLSFVPSVAPVYAQAAASATTTPTAPLRYDISKEVTLSATVQSVPSKSSHGLTPNSSLVLQTNSGTLQGSLTSFALNGKGALSISRGEHIQVTGVMTTMRNKQVFLIRTIQIGGLTYAIRNEHGFPIENPAGNPPTTTNSKGGQL